MGVLGELFAGAHATALERADVLDAGEIPSGAAPHIELTEIGPVELEALGEVAARAVRFGSGDLEVSEIDLAHDNLYRVPPFFAEVLVALGDSEEEDVVEDVAAQWAAEAEIDASAEDLARVVEAVVAVATRAAERGEDLFLWTKPV
ncbi:MAG: hypothetical protein H5T83_12600 [Actinotalea sp.]|nr:hypothetical protein [Actinotalea sp.]